ncbi:MAG TPA: iron-containing alcohol dehydrogenase [Firmicutes bacterium]|nr:iron-containing alcohol dehydrogenase [Bacillota bacterium]
MSDLVKDLPNSGSLQTKIALLSPNAADSLADFMREYYSNALIVCDENTEKYIALLGNIGKVVKLDGSSHANERGIAPLMDELSLHDYDCVVACGSGSLHDITRYCSHERTIDFISFPTAPSVDGFVSSVAAMTFGGRKVSFESASPVALFADERVLADSPARLTASGVGDILGKYTALFDWKIANLLCGEPIAAEVYDLMKSALGRLSALLDELISTADGDANRGTARGAVDGNAAHTIARGAVDGDIARNITRSSPEYIRCVMECLILAGLSMQLCGNSRPASGAEHHLSHFWEMNLVNKPCGALHGESVGCGTLLVARHYHAAASDRAHFTELLTCRPDLARLFDRSYLAPVFGDVTDGILDENLKNRDPLTSSLNFEISRECAERAADLTSSLISPERLEMYLKAAGAPTTPAELSLPEYLPKYGCPLAELSLKFAPYVRRRITLLKLLNAHDNI